MKNRYKKFIYEDERGITFEVKYDKGITLEVLEGADRELFIKARNNETNLFDLDIPTVKAGEYAEQLSIYTDKDGNQAVVLPGWTVSGAAKENTIWGNRVSLVIYQIPKNKIRDINWDDSKELEFLKQTYSQLVWCPVALLDADGTLDGKNFDKKFGRRKYQKISEEGLDEPLTEGLLLQSESVKKYGGFYFTRYEISRHSKNGEIQSIKGGTPLNESDFSSAQNVIIEENTEVSSHLMYGAEKGSILAWLMKTGVKLGKSITVDTAKFISYCNCSEPNANYVAFYIK